MKTQSTVWRRLTQHYPPAWKLAWQLYWTEERKTEVTFVVGSFLVSSLFFWFVWY